MTPFSEEYLFYASAAGIVLIVTSLYGFVRHMHLLEESREDYKDVGRVPGLSIMGKFFIHANYIHLMKLMALFLTGALIVVSDLPGLQDDLLGIRFVTVPITLVVVSVFAVCLGELEARARRSTKQYYRNLRTEQDRQDILKKQPDG